MILCTIFLPYGDRCFSDPECHSYILSQIARKSCIYLKNFTSGCVKQNLGFLIPLTSSPSDGSCGSCEGRKKTGRVDWCDILVMGIIARWISHVSSGKSLASLGHDPHYHMRKENLYPFFHTVGIFVRVKNSWKGRSCAGLSAVQCPKCGQYTAASLPRIRCNLVYKCGSLRDLVHHNVFSTTGCQQHVCAAHLCVLSEQGLSLHVCLVVVMVITVWEVTPNLFENFLTNVALIPWPGFPSPAKLILLWEGNGIKGIRTLVGNGRKRDKITFMPNHNWRLIWDHSHTCGGPGSTAAPPSFRKDP